MPISKLQNADINILRSSQAIHTPCSIVKELVENALDASASSISIEVDDTAIGSILVKDNGNGVSNGNGDRESMCLSFTTSKISAFEDLETVSTLGFRGEALSSIAQLAGSMEVTTRTKEDSVASKWTVSDNGVAGRFKVAPDPVGTTIVVKNLFKNMPVRRKLFLKNPKKNTADIKDLIFRFGLLNVSVRISLKICGKRPQVNTYPPGRSIYDMVSDHTVQSFQKNLRLFTELNETVGQYSLSCLLNHTPHDLSETSQSLIKRQCLLFGINGRLLSNNLATAKQLLKIFRQSRPHSDMKDICCLHIRCPPSALDVNLEPSKDDVLLHDNDGFIAAWQSVLTKAYPSRDALSLLMANSSTSLPSKEPSVETQKIHTRKSLDLAQSLQNSSDLNAKQADDQQLFILDESEGELKEPSNNSAVTNTRASPEANLETEWSFSMHDSMEESFEQSIPSPATLGEADTTVSSRAPISPTWTSQVTESNKVSTPPTKSLNLDDGLPSDHNTLSPQSNISSVGRSQVPQNARSTNPAPQVRGGPPVTPISSSPLLRKTGRELRQPLCPPSPLSAPPYDFDDDGIQKTPSLVFNKLPHSSKQNEANVHRKVPDHSKQKRLEVNKMPPLNDNGSSTIWGSKYGIFGDLRNYRTFCPIDSLSNLLIPSSIEIGGIQPLDIEDLAAFLEEKYCADSLDISKSCAGWYTLRDVQ